MKCNGDSMGHGSLGDGRKYEVSLVECFLCAHRWVAVRLEGLYRIQCPNCSNMVEFENVSCE